MPAPSVNALQVTFPAGCKYVIGAGLRRDVIAINAATLALDACSSGQETKTINWKQWDQKSGAAVGWLDAPNLGFIPRTSLSGVSAVVDSVAVPSGNILVHPRGKVATNQVVSDPLKTADVTYTYKRERYDLIHVGLSGDLGVTKGQEVDFAASEFLPKAPIDRYPLFYAYIWNDTVELIDAHSWSGASPRNKLQAARLAALRAYNQGKLTRLITKLQEGGAIVAGYGDSITAVGGGWAATGGADDTTYLASQSGGAARDSSSFLYWHDAALRAKYPELGAAWPQVNPVQVEWGEGKKFCAALAEKYGASVTWKNWGIGGTSSGTGNAANGAPNLGDTTRLANFNADTFDAVIYDAEMNDFVGAATGDLITPVTNNINAIKAAHPNADIIIRCTKGINSDNPNSLAWLQNAGEALRRVAQRLGCAFVPTYMVTHDDPGFLQISRQHYSGGNRYNHQTPYELTKMAQWQFAALGF